MTLLSTEQACFTILFSHCPGMILMDAHIWSYPGCGAPRFDHILDVEHPDLVISRMWSTPIWSYPGCGASRFGHNLDVEHPDLVIAWMWSTQIWSYPGCGAPRFGHNLDLEHPNLAHKKQRVRASIFWQNNPEDLSYKS